MKHFERFIQSPYHNRSRQCLIVFEVIRVYYDNQNLEHLNKERLLQTLLQDIKKIHTLDVVISKLTRLLEEFITLETLHKHKYVKKHLLIEGLMTHQQLDYANSILKTSEKDRLHISKKGLQFYFEEYLLTSDKYQHSLFSRDKNAQTLLLENIDALDKFYIIERLRLSYEVANRETMEPISYDEEMLQQIMELVRIGNMQNNPLIDLFYTTLLSLKEQDNENHFQRLLYLIDKYQDQISRETLDDIYKTLANFCVTKIVKGETQYMQTLFIIQKTQAEQGNLFFKKYISPQLIKNIVALGSQLGEFEWTNHFIESHTKFVQPEIRESIYHFNKGTLAFYQSNYKDAMYHLNEMDKMDLSFELGRKTILLRSYYELGEEIAFDALCKSFKEFIHSQKGMAGRLKKAYVNFAIVLRQIERIRSKGKSNTDKLDRLRSKINAYEYLSNKPWLTEKVRELADKTH